MTAPVFSRRRRLVSGLGAATALGLLVGLLGGEPRRISVEIWLVVATAWSAWLLIGELTSAAPLRPDRIEGFFKRARTEHRGDERARRLANLEGLIANAAHSQRAASIRLRPRLITLTQSLLRSSHGIDLADEPEAAGRVLGDVGWIVDEDRAMDRSPTPAEVELLVTRAAGSVDAGSVDRSGRPRPLEQPSSDPSPEGDR